SYDLLGFLGALPWAKAPRVVVLDNAGLHTGGVIRAARAGLARRGGYLFFLPPYSPGVDEIEAVLPPGEDHRDPRAGRGSPARAPRGGRGGLRGLRPAAPTETCRKTTSGCLVAGLIWLLHCYRKSFYHFCSCLLFWD